MERLTPLDDPGFFAQAWEGDGELPVSVGSSGCLFPGRLHFKTYTTPVSDNCWLVRERRAGPTTASSCDGICRQHDATTLRMTYDDMVGGTEVRLRADGLLWARTRWPSPPLGHFACRCAASNASRRPEPPPARLPRRARCQPQNRAAARLVCSGVCG